MSGGIVAGCAVLVSYLWEVRSHRGAALPSLQRLLAFVVYRSIISATCLACCLCMYVCCPLAPCRHALCD